MRMPGPGRGVVGREGGVLRTGIAVALPTSKWPRHPLVQPLTPQLLNMVGRPGVLGGGGGGQQVGGGGVKPLRGGVEVPLGRAHFWADGGS